MRNIIQNFSEIQPLRRVLMHRPGEEFLNLTPNTLERLLFDDIPYLKIAQQEHDAYSNALRAEGVEVVYLTDLAAEAIDAGGRTVRRKFLEQLIAEAGVTSPKVVQHCFDFGNKINPVHQGKRALFITMRQKSCPCDKIYSISEPIARRAFTYRRGFPFLANILYKA